MSRDFWFGVCFSLTDQASDLLGIAKAIEDKDEKGRSIQTATVLICLNKAIRAGLDRELERQDLRSK